jgi:hypothetical protein
VSTTFAPPEPGRHGWADLLRLLDAMRRLVELTEEGTARGRQPHDDRGGGRPASLNADVVTADGAARGSQPSPAATGGAFVPPTTGGPEATPRAAVTAGSPFRLRQSSRWPNAQLTYSRVAGSGMPTGPEEAK